MENSPELDVLSSVFVKWGEEHDLEKLVSYKATSLVESFHSLCNKYCPKHMHRGHTRYILKKGVARLHWNELMDTEGQLTSDRRDVMKFQKTLMSAIMLKVKSIV